MRTRPRIRVKRVYEPACSEDGTRILVDRLWPRGLTRERCAVYAWLKNAAPSDDLRKWFGHDPSRWEEFRRRYFGELLYRPQEVEFLIAAVQRGPVTFLFGARDEDHNNAVALKSFLERLPVPHKPRAPGAAGSRRIAHAHV